MPASSLILTPGAADANAYVDASVADQLNLDRPQFGTTAASGLWSAATAEEKKQAILWATVLMDRHFEWYGAIVYTTQRLLWPRNGLVDVNGWKALDYTTIPEPIQQMTAELARQLL